jgi:hypothetical protein
MQVDRHIPSYHSQGGVSLEITAGVLYYGIVVLWYLFQQQNISAADSKVIVKCLQMDLRKFLSRAYLTALS